MLQLFKTNDRKIVVKEAPAPVCDANEVLIETKYSIISSGTETMAFKNNESGSLISSLQKKQEKLQAAYKFLNEKGIQEFIRKYNSQGNLSSVSGYSLSGVVIEKGINVNEFEIGDRVSAAGSGFASHAEIVCVPKNLVAKIPDNVEFLDAAFATIGAIALQGVRLNKPQFGETICVVGLGLIGIITSQILKSQGCRVIGIDINEKRLQYAAKYNIDYLFLASADDLISNIKKISNGYGADAAIITAASKSSDPINQAAKYLRKKGKLTIVGAVGMELNREPFYEKEIQMTVSCSYGPGRYDDKYEIAGVDYPYAYVRWTEKRNLEAFLWALSRNLIDARSLVTETYEIQNSDKAFEQIIKNPDENIAIAIKYSRDIFEKNKNTIYFKFDEKEKKYLQNKEKIGIGVIGAGGYANRTHLPLIYKNNDFKLVGISSKTSKSCLKAASEFQAEYASTDYLQLLNDSKIEAVIISSRHNLHFQMTIDALTRGKNVLVEKPMALKKEEVLKLAEIAQSKGLILAVGYNRRYSPIAVKIKSLLEKELKPFLISYRINAGFVEKDSWVQDPLIGGGRIIGEGCHFIDFCNYLIGDEIESVKASAISPNGSTVINYDNYFAALKYKNGSMALINYTALGADEQPKELIEIFVNGKSIVVEDFVECKFFGFKEKNIKLKTQNKGREEQLKEFAKAIKGQPNNLITLEESASAALTAIEINDIILNAFLNN